MNLSIILRSLILLSEFVHYARHWQRISPPCHPIAAFMGGVINRQLKCRVRESTIAGRVNSVSNDLEVRGKMARLMN